MLFYLTEVQEKLKYVFKDSNLIRTAFTHPSYSNERKSESDYDRLEFLGDSVLGFVVADYLYRKSVENEGEMTKNKINIVSSIPLAMATKKLNVDKYLLINQNMAVTDKVRENLFEAIVGAIYLDGGLIEARKFIFNNLICLIDKKGNSKKEKDYKSAINELSTKKRLGTIKYALKSKTGGDHNPEFTMQLLLNDKVIAEGKGNSKKSAEQLCAKKALQKLSKVGK